MLRSRVAARAAQTAKRTGHTTGKVSRTAVARISKWLLIFIAMYAVKKRILLLILQRKQFVKNTARITNILTMDTHGQLVIIVEHLHQMIITVIEFQIKSTV